MVLPVGVPWEQTVHNSVANRSQQRIPKRGARNARHPSFRVKGDNRNRFRLRVLGAGRGDGRGNRAVEADSELRHRTHERALVIVLLAATGAFLAAIFPLTAGFSSAETGGERSRRRSWRLPRSPGSARRSLRATETRSGRGRPARLRRRTELCGSGSDSSRGREDALRRVHALRAVLCRQRDRADRLADLAALSALAAHACARSGRECPDRRPLGVDRIWGLPLGPTPWHTQ